MERTRKIWDKWTTNGWSGKNYHQQEMVYSRITEWNQEKWRTSHQNEPWPKTWECNFLRVVDVAPARDMSLSDRQAVETIMRKRASFD